MVIRQSKNNVTVALLAALVSMSAAGTAGADESGSDVSEKTLCQQAAYTMALKYQQKSSEVAALQRQGFTLAIHRLEQLIAEHGGDENLAIITDLDETVLDNTKLLARDLAECHDYTTWDTWKHWEREGKPSLIPGSMEFLEFADENDVAIYYISDRYRENKDATLATLNALGLPQVSESSVQLLGPPKEERRADVKESHTLIMQLGDTLSDFSHVFEDASLGEQRQLVAEHAEHFGNDWIMFPNASYGSWIDATLDQWDAPFETE